MNDQDRALAAFENALRHNPNSILGLNAVASIMRGRDNFDKAIEYFQRILNIKQDNGEVWGSMGECGVSRTLLTPRPLPADEGRPAKGVHRLPAGALPLAQPQSMSSRLTPIPLADTPSRSQSSGTASAYCTTVTARLSTPKKPSPVFSRWIRVSGVT